MTATIPLTRGLVALVDDEDVEMLSQIKWHVDVATSKRVAYYAVSMRGSTRAKTVRTYMHRLLLNAPAHLQVDHINGNSLDNRRANLRLATSSQNNANRRLTRNSTGYRGVSSDGRGKFVAVVWDRGRPIRGPHRATPLEASYDYDRLAAEHYGEFAVLNHQADAA